MFSDWFSLLPLTALIAVLIFISREVLEFFRRRKADARKLHALKALLARECELNFWSLKAFRHIFESIHTGEDAGSQVRIEIQQSPSGKAYIYIVTHDDKAGMRTPIPKVHRELMTKFLLDVATLDRKLFEVLEPAYDSMAEMEHIRESLMNIQDGSELIGEEHYVEGLAEYALEELEDVEGTLGSLYVHCTGKALTKHRLR